MKFHKEGKPVIIESFLINGGLAAIVVFVPFPKFIPYFFIPVFLFLFLWSVYFFRVPERKIKNGDHILSSADGRIVAIEEVYEGEYFKENRLQISVFMSGFDVHVNWYPFEGMIKYTKYHPGKYHFARHPKSSAKNERSSIVLEKEPGKDVLIRQVAGFMARRIVFYGRPGDSVKQGEQLGMIRFGSRVDFFLPVNAVPSVKLGQKVTAQRSVIGYFS